MKRVIVVDNPLDCPLKSNCEVKCESLDFPKKCPLYFAKSVEKTHKFKPDEDCKYFHYILTYPDCEYGKENRPKDLHIPCNPDRCPAGYH